MNDDFKNNYKHQGEVITFVKDLYIYRRYVTVVSFNCTREALDAQTRESKRIDAMKFQFDFDLIDKFALNHNFIFARESIPFYPHDIL